MVVSDKGIGLGDSVGVYQVKTVAPSRLHFKVISSGSCFIKTYRILMLNNCRTVALPTHLRM